MIKQTSLNFHPIIIDTINPPPTEEIEEIKFAIFSPDAISIFCKFFIICADC